MTYSQTLDYIHSLGMFSLPPTLDRIKEVLAKLGDPQNDFKAVHIAGTNGKGSTAAYCAEALSASGLKTGLFTSPYIIEFRDRIRIDGEFIPEGELIRLAERVKSTSIRLTEFEFITAVGFLYFSEQGVDIAVIEVGLGGRFDATNALPSPEAAVITKIGLDHTAVLGETVEKIAAEKCGIIKDGAVISAPFQRADALKVIKNSAQRLSLPDEGAIKILSVSHFGNEFIYKDKKYKTALSGIHQVHNAVTAIEVLSALGVPHEAVEKGLSSAFIPARLERISSLPLVILDGAHNPDGGEVLAEFMKSFSGNITAVIGMVRDKDCESFLSLTLPHTKNVITVKAANIPRALEADELRETAAPFCEDITAARDIPEAIGLAIKKSAGNPIFIFGSLYLASSARPYLLKTFK